MFCSRNLVSVSLTPWISSSVMVHSADAPSHQGM
uniref:Uncharacterized protein n=1 Tax=Lepeophtheirus salmonis TaxID=72036 RepID=A0A0K2TTT1_LEPSM